jgi:hypothetical protein
MFPILRDMSSIKQFPVGSAIINRQLGQPLSSSGRVNAPKVSKTLSVGHMGCHHLHPSPFHSPLDLFKTHRKQGKGSKVVFQQPVNPNMPTQHLKSHQERCRNAITGKCTIATCQFKQRILHNFRNPTLSG